MLVVSDCLDHLPPLSSSTDANSCIVVPFLSFIKKSLLPWLPLPCPAIRQECIYLFGRSTAPGFLIKAIGSDGATAAHTIAGFKFFEMLLHVLKGVVDCFELFRVIGVGNNLVVLTDDYWMGFTNVQDDCIRVFFDAVIVFLVLSHFHLFAHLICSFGLLSRS